MFVKDALVNKLNKNIIFYYLDAKPNCLSPCCCLFCAKCANKIIEHQMMTCPICKNQINFQKITGLNNELLSLIENQDSNIKKMQQIIKIQKKNKAQFINYLEHKIKSLAEENKNLKKYIIVMERTVNNNINNNRDIMSKSYYSTNTAYYNNMNNSFYNYSTTSSYNITNNSVFKTPNVADRNSNLKRIEVKKSSERQSSIKYSPYINKYNDNLNNIKNLNAQTAFEQQYSSKQGNNINVNINNNNSNRRSINFSRSNNNSVEKIDVNQKNFGKYNRY